MTKLYGVRFRKQAKGSKWKRSRTIRNPKGIWKKAGADYIVNLLRKRGYLAHRFELVIYPNATHYSKHFTKAELRCKCGCKPNSLVERNLTELAADLEVLRVELGGSPVNVNSGHRCWSHNERVGGARNSRHILGEAADLSVPAGQQPRYVAAANRVRDFAHGGIGSYPNGSVHVDHRPWYARWTSFSR